MNDVTKRILSLAESRGISDQELCRAIGAKKDKVNSWKIGRSKPTTDETVVLAKYFNVTADYLLTGETEEKPVDYDELSEDTNELLDIYNKLDSEKQKEILNFAKYQKSEQNR